MYLSCGFFPTHQKVKAQKTLIEQGKDVDGEVERWFLSSPFWDRNFANQVEFGAAESVLGEIDRHFVKHFTSGGKVLKPGFLSRTEDFKLANEAYRKACENTLLHKDQYEATDAQPAARYLTVWMEQILRDQIPIPLLTRTFVKLAHSFLLAAKPALLEVRVLPTGLTCYWSRS